MKFAFGLMMAGVALASGAAAQEETTGGSGWNALARDVRAQNLKLGNMDYRLGKLEVCSRVARIYSPGNAFSDGNGCVDASAGGDTQSVVKDLQAHVEQLEASVNSDRACRQSGMVYSAPLKRCVDSEAASCKSGTMAVGSACVDTATTMFVGTDGAYGQVTPYFASAMQACVAQGKRVATRTEFLALCLAGKGPAEGTTVYLEPGTAARGCSIALNALATGVGNGETVCSK